MAKSWPKDVGAEGEEAKPDAPNEPKIGGAT
jgi:hypothetical protein